MAEKTKNYAKGVFGKHFENEYGIKVRLGIKLEEFIPWLESLPVTDQGFVNVELVQQKDLTKWSMYENDWKPTYSKTQTVSQGSTSNRKPVAASADDTDLPF